MGAGQIFNLPRTDDFSRRGKVPSHLTAKVVSTVAFQNKIKNLSCTRSIFYALLVWRNICILETKATTMNRIKLLLPFVAALFTLHLDAQDQPYNTDNVYKDYVRTVQCFVGNSPLSYPILNLGGGFLTLSFDDLEADIKDYYYTITHCNADWTPSNLNTMEYIDGFETEEILNYEYSFNTFVEYTHYELTLPNNNMAYTKSGNYILKVFLDNDLDDVVLTRRFIVVDNQVSVNVDMVIPISVRKKRTHHEIDFSILHNNLDIRAPRQDVNVVVMQNGRWDTALDELKPVFVRGKEMIYDHQDKITFPAGREYRYVDLSSTRVRGDFVRELEDDGKMYYMHVIPDRNLKDLSHIQEQRDINGRYVISNAHESNDVLESDYITTFFTYQTDKSFDTGSIYLFGQLTDWQIKPEYEMSYVAAQGSYQLKTLLKQGIYNYTYAYVDDETGTTDANFSDGNWYQTENDYHILVYYRPFGARYDQLINVTPFKSLW